MTVQTDDVTLRVKLDLSDIDKERRPGGSGGARVPGRDPGGTIPGGRGPGRPDGGRVPGRDPGGFHVPKVPLPSRPGLSSLGKFGVGAAAAVALIHTIDKFGPAAGAFLTEADPFFSNTPEEFRRLAREEAVNIWEDNVGKYISTISGITAGAGQTISDVGSLLSAGFDISEDDAGAVLGRNIDIATQESQIERKKNRIGQLRTGAKLGKMLAEKLGDDGQRLLFDQLGIKKMLGEAVTEVLKEHGMVGRKGD